MKLNELNTIRHVLLPPVFELDEFPAAAYHDAGVVARYRDAPGIVDGTVLQHIVARHRIDSESAEAVGGCNGIDGQLLGNEGVSVGDIDTCLGKAGVCAFGLGAGVACRVAEDGDAEERGNHGLEVGAGCRIFPQSGGEVRAVARVVG